MPASVTPRRFPPPLMVEEHAESFITRDATGQALAYFYDAFLQLSHTIGPHFELLIVWGVSRRSVMVAIHPGGNSR